MACIREFSTKLRSSVYPHAAPTVDFETGQELRLRMIRAMNQDKIKLEDPHIPLM